MKIRPFLLVLCCCAGLAYARSATSSSGVQTAAAPTREQNSGKDAAQSAAPNHMQSISEKPSHSEPRNGNLNLRESPRDPASSAIKQTHLVVPKPKTSNSKVNTSSAQHPVSVQPGSPSPGPGSAGLKLHNTTLLSPLNPPSPWFPLSSQAQRSSVKPIVPTTGLPSAPRNVAVLNGTGLKRKP